MPAAPAASAATPPALGFMEFIHDPSYGNTSATSGEALVVNPTL